jgi:hypothetical protein
MTADRKETTVPADAGKDYGAARLRALRRALIRRGMTCDVDTRAIWPRLRVRSPYEDHRSSVAEFENSVVAAQFDDGWWFAWLWAEKISEVTRVRSAADKISLILGSPSDESSTHSSTAVTLAPPLKDRH